jgi:hypothetical protein
MEYTSKQKQFITGRCKWLNRHDGIRLEMSLELCDILDGNCGLIWLWITIDNPHLLSRCIAPQFQIQGATPGCLGDASPQQRTWIRGPASIKASGCTCPSLGCNQTMSLPERKLILWDVEP